MKTVTITIKTEAGDSWTRVIRAEQLREQISYCREMKQSIIINSWSK